MFKRFFDVVSSLILITVLLPVFGVVSLLSLFFIGKPVLFSQSRPGLKGKVFKMYKFRTMSDARDCEGQLLGDELRLSKYGKLLRASSLDELPELINILKGDMSLVGPRPLLNEYLELYSVEQFRRHEVRPGITGWAQVNGRNDISWDEKFKLDVWYVENQTFWLDLKILFLTLVKVFNREGISASGHATTSKFTGSKDDR